MSNNEIAKRATDATSLIADVVKKSFGSSFGLSFSTFFHIKREPAVSNAWSSNVMEMSMISILHCVLLYAEAYFIFQYFNKPANHLNPGASFGGGIFHRTSLQGRDNGCVIVEYFEFAHNARNLDQLYLSLEEGLLGGYYL